MRINKLNYEVYAIDYIDGTLPNDLKAEMEQFLLMNPDVAKDVAMFGEVVFVPDTSVKYMAKQELKKPVQFAILKYMNWIVPICMSIAFMAAYPYLRTVWHADETETKPIEVNQDEASTKKVNNFTPISSNEGSQNVNVNAETTRPLVSNADVQPVVYSSNISDRNDNSINSTTLEGSSFSDKIVDNNDETVIQEQVSEVENHLEEESEGQSIVDFGYNVIGVSEEEDLVFLEDYPNKIGIDNQLNTDILNQLIKREKVLGYITFSIQPLSVGYDMAKTTNITTQNELIRNLPMDSEGEIIIGEPRQVGFGVDYHLSDFVKLGTGFQITSRNISYQALNENSTTLDIQYRTFSVPALATFKMPLDEKYQNALHLTGGFMMNWMGQRNYSGTNHTGDVDLEKKGTASLFNDNTKLITTNSALKVIPSLQFGLAYHKDLYQYGGLTFGIDYNRQLLNINNIRLYDYDIDTQFRSNVMSYDIRFETVNASIKYTLPYRWRMKQLRNKQ